MTEISREMTEYIEREATVKAFCEQCADYSENGCTYTGACDVSIIATVPAADVQPVKHGKWEKKKGYLVCSNCGMIFDTIGYTYEEQEELFRYCSRCGYRMK